MVKQSRAFKLKLLRRNDLSPHLDIDSLFRSLLKFAHFLGFYSKMNSIGIDLGSRHINGAMVRNDGTVAIVHQIKGTFSYC